MRVNVSGLNINQDSKLVIELSQQELDALKRNHTLSQRVGLLIEIKKVQP